MIVVYALAFGLLVPLVAEAKSHHTVGAHASTQSRAIGVQRDSHGRIKRSRNARAAFERSHPCPSTGRTSGACPGHVVDHVQPLKRGGADRPGNMHWQTTQAAKEKDKWE